MKKTQFFNEKYERERENVLIHICYKVRIFAILSKKEFQKSHNNSKFESFRI